MTNNNSTNKNTEVEQQHNKGDNMNTTLVSEETIRKEVTVTDKFRIERTIKTTLIPCGTGAIVREEVVECKEYHIIPCGTGAILREIDDVYESAHIPL